MSKIQHWIYFRANAYVEVTFVPWLNRNVYRRSVDFNSIVWC